MDPPTYTPLAALDRESLAPAALPAAGPRPSSASTVAAATAASSVSLLLAPLEGRSTFLSGRLLPLLRGRAESGTSGTVTWEAAGSQPIGSEQDAASEVRGEVQTKGVKLERVEQLCVGP